MLVTIYPDKPNLTEVQKVVQILQNGGVIIYPTDTVYALGCDIFCAAAVEKICRFKKIDSRKAHLSFVCANLSQVSEYAKFDNATFKILKSSLPGPFTFILNGSSRLPKLFKKRQEVGVRIPDNNIVRAILDELGHPLMSASVPKDEDGYYITNADLLAENYHFLVDAVVDGGDSDVEPSTIIDCTGNTPEIIRQGKGLFDI